MTIQNADTMAAVLVGNDTNLLVLLLHHAGHQNHKIFFAPEPKKNSKSCIKGMGEIQRRLGSYVCRQLLFTHTLLGCDTTSRLHGIGKALLLKKIRSLNAPLPQKRILQLLVRES